MNSSYLQKPNEVERKWYIIDAADKPLGRVAAPAASILRGKHLPTFTPNVDCGDHVIIINAARKAVLDRETSSIRKVRYYHTGWGRRHQGDPLRQAHGREARESCYGVRSKGHAPQHTQSAEKLLQDFACISRTHSMTHDGAEARLHWTAGD